MSVVKPTPAPRRGRPKPVGNDVPVEVLKDVVHQSGITERCFAQVLGISYQSLRALLRGRQRLRPYHLYAAKYCLVRLGHEVQLERVDRAQLRPAARKRP